MRWAWLWQNVVDYWSLAHCWGWALGAWIATRWLKPPVVLVVAILLGISWEVVEASWVEAWLRFREPLGNRLADIVVDSLGAWFGVRMSVDSRKRLR